MPEVNYCNQGQHDRTPVTTKHENSGERAHNGIRHCAIKLG